MKIGLGHRRLSIIDLSSAGHQPMSNEDKTIWITFNGEIYNHQEIRTELEKKGHLFRSHCDTESIIHLYEEKGPDCVSYFQGMFSFCLWDKNRRQLFLARDRAGIKPLYYTRFNGIFAFASEIKALFALPHIKKELDYHSLYHYLTYATTPAPRTMFKGIYKLPAASSMIVDRSGEIRTDIYWDPISLPPLPDENEEFYRENLLDLLRKSIKRRMMADVPFGVFLSGGVDSSMNVALMSELMDRPVETFSVGFKQESESDERHYARQIADKFQTNHHEIFIDDNDFENFFSEMTYIQDEPLADPVCVPLYYVSRLARENNVIVIQVGEGSDELFFGYDHFYDYLKTEKKFKKPVELLPGPVRNLILKSMFPFFDTARQEVIERVRRGNELFWGGAIAYGELEKRRILSDAMLETCRTEDSYAEVDVFYQALNRSHYTDKLARMAYLELKIRLPELLLMRVDKMAMGCSIETRVPYLDHELIECALRIPAKYKRKNGINKYILKKVAEDFLPQNIIYRKKIGFCGSSANMLTERLFALTRELIDNSTLTKEVFHRSYLQNALNQHRLGKSETSSRMWNLLNLCLWYNHWFG
jgi:asparagine synthase (glutamine-hydrolysing)